jgi:hypothetical protein
VSTKHLILAGLLGAALWHAGPACAQEPMRPRTSEELWMSAQVRGRAPKFMKDLLGDHYKRLRFSSALGYRSADNFFAGRQIYTEVNARYRFNKHFNFGTEYRYANRGVQQADRHRFLLIGRAATRWKRFSFNYRFIHQWVFLEQDRNSTFIRNRFGVEYNIRKWKLDPVFQMELFTRTDQPQGWNHVGTRFKLGTDIKIADGHFLGPTLVYDSDARVADPVNRVIYSIGYTMDLRRL